MKRKYIGMSDIANLILAGSSDNGLKLAVLHFGMDNDYYAYIVDADAEIGEHYTKVAEFKSWLRIAAIYTVHKRRVSGIDGKSK